LLGKRAKDAPNDSAGVVATACVQEEDWCNTGNPITRSDTTIDRTPARDRPGMTGWRRGPQYRRSRVTPMEGRDLSSRRAQEAARNGRLGNLVTPPSVQKLQTALHAKAKGKPSFRFYALYDRVYREDVLRHAYACCKSNDGAAGLDEERFEDIETYGLDRWLGELAKELKEKTYKPQAARRVYIPKQSGSGLPLRAQFDEQHGSSDGGAILLKACDAALDLNRRVAACLMDRRQAIASSSASLRCGC
jgi:hypothetical protein